MQKKHYIGKDVYGDFYKRNGTTFRIGNCIKIYTTHILSKVIGEIVSMGKNDKGYEFLIINEFYEGQTGLREIYLHEIYD